jgi:hypothetical protein
MNRTIIPAEIVAYELEIQLLDLGIKDSDLLSVTTTKDLIEIRKVVF